MLLCIALMIVKPKQIVPTTQHESTQHTETHIRDGIAQKLRWQSARMTSSLNIMDYYDHNKHY